MNTVNDQTIITTLREHNAYVTQNRIAVLKVLSEAKGSVSVARIRKLSLSRLDRVSIYRTLNFLIQKGLILSMPGPKGNLHYVLKDNITRHLSTGRSQIIHFTCSKCGCTEITESSIPFNTGLPDQYVISKSHIILEGVCSKCR